MSAKIVTITDPIELLRAQLQEIRDGNAATRKEIKQLRELLRGGENEQARLEAELDEALVVFEAAQKRKREVMEEIFITNPHFPATKYVIGRPSKPGGAYINEFYNVDRNDWSQAGTLFGYKSHAETVYKALLKAIDATGKPSLDKNVCPCEGCKPKTD